TQDVSSMNLISGNSSNGIALYGTGSTNNRILNNFIGGDVTGKFALPNSIGINVNNTSSNFIGGSTASSRNIISGNTTAGISVQGTTANNRITGNFIGTNISGTAAIPNSRGLVLFSADSNLIGGAETGAGNLISGNMQQGLYIHNSSNNLILGNKIGTQQDGYSPLPNGQMGLLIFNNSNDNTIGGILSGQHNLIAHNPEAVVLRVISTLSSPSNPLNNHISGNQIFSNTNIGIDLGNIGITINDTDDADNGPNRLQNFPEILDEADFDGTNINLSYFVPSAPANSAYPIWIEFFIDDGNRQGKEFLYSQEFTEADYNNGPFKVISFQPPTGSSFTAGDLILATTTDANGNTSEFGGSVAVTTEEPNSAPIADAGPNQTLTDTEEDGEEEVTLDGSVSTDSDGTIVTYSWSISGTEIATGINPVVTLPLGSNTILLTVTDNDGATDTDEVVILVN